MNLNSQIDELIGVVSGMELDGIRRSVSDMLKADRPGGYSIIALASIEAIKVVGMAHEDVADAQRFASTCPLTPEELQSTLPMFIDRALDEGSQEAISHACTVLLTNLTSPPGPDRFYFAYWGVNLKNEPFAFVFSGRLPHAVA